MASFRKEIALAVEKAIVGRAKQAEIVSLLEVPPSPEMGDFAFPCFKLAGQMRKKPNEIASQLASKIELPKGIERVEAKGPYLNFFVAKQSIASQAIDAVLKQGKKYGHSSVGKDKKVMVEYSAPNANKPLHLGHLRNNSIGMAVANLFEANGFKVVKANLVNDRGIHICKSMLAYKLFGENKKPGKQKPDHFVGNFYVMYNKKVGEQPSLEKQAYDLLQLWEKKDKATIALWKKMTDWVVKGFKETYKQFGSEFDTWFFESELYDKAGPILDPGKKEKVFKEDDEGALVAQLEAAGLPNKTVLRSDKTTIYITNDLALTKKKFEKFKLDKGLWIVGSEQDLYFRQLFKIFELLGFKWAKDCVHLSHGMVYLPSGKLKSREGRVIDADDIIGEMTELAAKEIRKRDEDIAQKELDKRSRAIALAAIKFHMLKIAVQKDLLFNPAESISFEGETGPYIQYSFARAKSILRKAKNFKRPESFDLLFSREEQLLAKLLLKFPKEVEKSLKQLSPHVVCQFLIELAESFNSFYHKHRVIQAESKELRNQRLALVEATAQVLKNGLHLLDIEAIEKM